MPTILVKPYCWIRHGDRVVLMRDTLGIPGWKMVGGTMEAGETLIQTMIREAREEVGLTIEPSTIIGRHEFFRPVGSANYHLRLFFDGTSTTSDLTIDANEVAEARWFTMDELRSIPAEQLHIEHRQTILRQLHS